MASPLTRTPQGWEVQFATNHLGHFALATGLHGALAAATGSRDAANEGGRRSWKRFQPRASGSGID
jgi:NAD(P)-dependent dehydrogenase (short-subunit alcohol dehydrogenase family)